MSTAAAPLNLTMANATVNSGLKLLVTKGPQAQKAVGIWLFGCAAWVFSLVILGGVTRLTRSGLSMTDWKFTGGLPPMSDEDQWLMEFEKYKQSPEYKRVNKGMSVEDFKFIYWMEYAHRLWGRALGFVFAVPFTYFVAKGYVTNLDLRLSALFALGGGQGLIGWWMVKSGLEEPAPEHVQPRVSPYRLATHLTSAFVIYCGILRIALSVVMPDPPAGSMNWVNGAAKIRKQAIPVSAVAGITAISGAFVAGNDAGHAYNSFPKMGDTWIPEDVFSMEPFIRNFFENTSTVQATFVFPHGRSLQRFMENVAEHTGMPSTAVPPPPPPPPTYEVSTSPNLSLEPHTSGSAIGVENPNDTLNRIARGMFGGYVNASVSADGNYSSPLDDDLNYFNVSHGPITCGSILLLQVVHVAFFYGMTNM